MGTQILWIYHKYKKNIDEYFDKNIREAKIIQNLWKYLKIFQNNKQVKYIF